MSISERISLCLIWLSVLSCNKKDSHVFEKQNVQVSESLDLATTSTLRPNVIVEETFEGLQYFPLSGTALNVISSIENCGTTWTLAKATSPVFEKLNSSRFEIRKNQDLVGSGERIRSEVTLIRASEDKRFTPEMWYSFAMLIPATGFEYDKTRDCINQWFEDGSDETTLRIEADRAYLEVCPPLGSAVMKKYDLFSTKNLNGGNPYSFTPIPKNTWHEFVFHFKHSLNSDGLIEVWRDGVKIHTINGRNIHKELPKWKLGLYKTSFMNNTSPWSSRIAYFDNIRVGRAGASLAEMSSAMPASTPTLTTNKIPVVNAGRDTAIVLPAGSLYLSGTTYDPDGSVKLVKWTQVSGPEGSSLVGDTSLEAKLMNLKYGKYVMRLTITDDRGGVGIDDMVVNVTSSTNINPVSDAGPDQYISGTSTTLDGTKSVDIDGSITKYLWEVSSGVSGWSKVLVLSTPTASKTLVSGLVSGVYVFRLTITDNKGVTASDKVTVTVSTSGQVNQKPVARAGSDQQITLPSTVTLDGSSSSDPDGTISKYSWSKISGGTATISTASSSKTSVTGLAAGTYVFRLTVTDNLGLTGYDDIKVTVLAASTTTASVGSFTLVNAATEKDIATIVNGGTYSISKLGTLKFNVRANATGAASVKFELTGPQTLSATDSAVPFALMGDNGSGNYYYGTWGPPPVGTYTLKATPYSGTKASGTAGTSYTIKFTFSL